jgi:hypothetical protein
MWLKFGMQDLYVIALNNNFVKIFTMRSMLVGGRQGSFVFIFNIFCRIWMQLINGRHPKQFRGAMCEFCGNRRSDAQHALCYIVICGLSG